MLHKTPRRGAHRGSMSAVGAALLGRVALNMPGSPNPFRHRRHVGPPLPRSQRSPRSRKAVTLPAFKFMENG